MINASDFVSLMTPNNNSKSFKLAVVKSISSGKTIVQFDGEEESSNKSYSRLGSYLPTVGDRILLLNVGGTYVIAGEIVI